MIPGIEDVLFKDFSETNEDVVASSDLLRKFYSSLLEELHGVADWFGRDLEYLRFLDSASLIAGGFSLATISSLKTIDNKSYVLRTYDLGENISDFRMCFTNINHGFTHSGLSVNFFGRSDGMNQYRLCVAFASCGLPIGNYPGILKTKITGLNFMVLVRTILEKCKTTSATLDLIQKVSIGTDMNLLISDSTGSTAIVEVIVGKIIADLSIKPITLATNHPVFHEGKQLQKKIFQ